MCILEIEVPGLGQTFNAYRKHWALKTSQTGHRCDISSTRPHPSTDRPPVNLFIEERESVCIVYNEITEYEY